MPRLLEYVEHPWQPFELLLRCHQSRLLLRPGRECNRRLVGVIARALELYGAHVHLYFAGGTSNHLHLIAAFRDAEWKARFKQHIKTNISKELGDLFDWPNAHWERRTRDIPILDDQAFEDRLVYLAAHAVKEGLTATPFDWPGVPWARAVAHGHPLVGVWYDRTALYRLRRAWRARPRATRGRRPVLHDVARELTLPLTPPPMWAHLDPADLQARWREIIALAVTRYPRPGRPLGPDAVCAADPHHRPAETKKTPAPAVHTREPALRRAWYAAYTAFAETYRAAMSALRAGAATVGFPPEGCRPLPLASG